MADPRAVDVRSAAEPPSAGSTLENDTHSFIVKIWLEDRVEKTGRARWRGHITHVPSGVRRYLRSLDDITAFMQPYLRQMGVRLGGSARLRRWLKQLRDSIGHLLVRRVPSSFASQLSHHEGARTL